MAESHYVFFRRRRNTPPDDLPFFARSAGHYSVNGNYVGGGRRKPLVQLYWCVAGEGHFYLRGRPFRLGPGQVCYYLPFDRQHVRPAGDYWEYYFMTLAGPLAEATIRNFGLPQEPFVAGNCPHYLFEMLGREIREDSCYSQRMASALSYQIMAIAGAGLLAGHQARQQHGDPFVHAVNLIRHSFANPETSVETIAETAGIHRATLTRRFQAGLKMSPKEYITQLRMERAAELLSGSSLPIKEIALMTGYNDSNYFEKVFHRYHGRTPGDYRLHSALHVLPGRRLKRLP